MKTAQLLLIFAIFLCPQAIYSWWPGTIAFIGATSVATGAIYYVWAKKTVAKYLAEIRVSAPNISAYTIAIGNCFVFQSDPIPIENNQNYSNQISQIKKNLVDIETNDQFFKRVCDYIRNRQNEKSKNKNLKFDEELTNGTPDKIDKTRNTLLTIYNNIKTIIDTSFDPRKEFHEINTLFDKGQNSIDGNDLWNIYKVLLRIISETESFLHVLKKYPEKYQWIQKIRQTLTDKEKYNDALIRWFNRSTQANQDLQFIEKKPKSRAFGAFMASALWLTAGWCLCH